MAAHKLPAAAPAIGARRRRAPHEPARRPPDLRTAATLPVAQVLAEVGSDAEGLTAAEARRRLESVGPNALRSHGARPLAVLGRQLRNPLLILLVAAALTSLFVGQHTDAGIILGIIALSVGLGFFNEYRSERAVEALHSRLRHTALALRDGGPASVDVTELVPGDVVRLGVGGVVPADLRLLSADGLECDEGRADGRAAPGRQAGRADPRAGVAARPAPVRVHGHRRARGRRRRGGRTDRRADRVRHDRPAARRAPAADRVPARPARVLAAARARHGGAGGVDPGHQRRARTLRAGVGAVRAGDRRRPDAAAAARDRDDQPGHGRQAARRPRPRSTPAARGDWRRGRSTTGAGCRPSSSRTAAGAR